MAKYTEQEIFKKVVEIADENLPEVKPDEMKMDSTIEGDLGLDSLALVLVMSKIETEFDVLFPEVGWDRMETVGDVVHTVEKLLAKKKD